MGTIFRGFGDLLTGNFRGLFHLLLGLAVSVALWETALFGLSARPAATGLFTEVGVQFINPVISNGSLGLAQNSFIVLQAQAKLRPNDPVIIPGLGPKVRILGKEIADKSYNDAMRVVYSHVADAYYDGGAGAAFAGVSGVQNAVGSIPILPIFGVSNGNSGSQPSLPSVGGIGQALTGFGFSMATLTAAGHTQVQTYMTWAWVVSAVLGALLFLFGKGWGRLTGVASTLVSSSLIGVVAIAGVFAYLHFNPNGLNGLGKIPGIIGGVFIPVYLGAVAVGVGGHIVAFIGKLVTNGGSSGNDKDAMARGPRREDGMASPAGSRYRGETQPMPDYGTPSYRPPAPRPVQPPAPQPGYTSPQRDFTPPAANPWNQPVQPGGFTPGYPQNPGFPPASPQPGFVPQQPVYPPAQQPGFPPAQLPGNAPSAQPQPGAPAWPGHMPSGDTQPWPGSPQPPQSDTWTR